jgi:cation:H+ antiporter
MHLTLIWIQLAGVAVVILIASHFLAKSADIIAEKTGMGRSLVGILLLATATSLPEMGTGISSIAMFGAPDLAAGDAFGSNLFNLLIIGLMDLYWRNGPILNAVSTNGSIIGFFSILSIGLASIAVFVNLGTISALGLNMSPISFLVVAVFAVATYEIYRRDRNKKESENNTEISSESNYANTSASKATLMYVISASIVVGAAVILAKTGDTLAEELGWEASFVGTLFLAFSTSLPELATSFAALKLKAPELAITNVLGSNLFNMGPVLFFDDVTYSQDSLWNGISNIHALSGGIAVLMTLIVIAGLTMRPRQRPTSILTIESTVLIALYATASILVFVLA